MRDNHSVKRGLPTASAYFKRYAARTFKGVRIIVFLANSVRSCSAKAVVIGVMLGAASVVSAREPEHIEQLETPNFIVRIEVYCKDGEYIVCDDVRYRGTEKKTGKSLTLTGSTLHRICGDGSPCQFTGYEFINGIYRYSVSVWGVLRVERNGKLLLHEEGKLELIK